MHTYYKLYVVGSELPATGLEELSIQILLGLNQLAVFKNLAKMLSNFNFPKIGSISYALHYTCIMLQYEQNYYEIY